MKKKIVKPSSEIIVEPISPSEEIAEIQLERLRAIARDRLLTFEETRIFDILTKNLLITQEQRKAIETSASDVSDKQEAISAAELIQIVQQTDISEALNIVPVKEDEDVKKTSN